MAATAMANTPPSTDIEMADAQASSPSSSNLSSPPSSGNEYEDIQEEAGGKENSPNQQLHSLENISLSSPITTATTTKVSNMASARRSTRNTNKPRPVFAVSPSRPTKRKIVSRVSTAKKAPRWTPEKLLTDPKSPLASADLRTILCQPAAWDILSKDERLEIIALMPQGTRILDDGTDNARPDFEALRNDNNFRHDCATYASNIAQGKHDPEWLEQAWAARERRRAGDFDGYLAQKFEDEWSCELPENFKPKRDVATASSAGEEEGEEEEEEVENGDSGNEVKDGLEVDSGGGNAEREEVKMSISEEACVDEKPRIDQQPDVEGREALKPETSVPESMQSTGQGAKTGEDGDQKPVLANGQEADKKQPEQENPVQTA